MRLCGSSPLCALAFTVHERASREELIHEHVSMHPGQLANLLPGEEPTLGLPGLVQLTKRGEIPRFTFAADVDHPLARQQREGIFPEQAIEWASQALHW